MYILNCFYIKMTKINSNSINNIFNPSKEMNVIIRCDNNIKNKISQIKLFISYINDKINIPKKLAIIISPKDIINVECTNIKIYHYVDILESILLSKSDINIYIKNPNTLINNNELNNYLIIETFNDQLLEQIIYCINNNITKHNFVENFKNNKN